MNRILDVVVAGTALVVGAPLMMALVTAIKLDSRGSALYIQTRVGRGGRLIRIPKLRTMVSDAAGPGVTSSGDPRITRIGALLRRTKLDELPQLWSIVRGDMSLVGPRPEVPEFVERYRPEWKRLLEVRPGLTDIASLTFRDEERLLGLARDPEQAYLEVIMPMKLGLALAGLERTTVLDDMNVILRTALAVFGHHDTRDHAILAEAQRRIEQLNRASST